MNYGGAATRLQVERVLSSQSYESDEAQWHFFVHPLVLTLSLTKRNHRQIRPIQHSQYLTSRLSVLLEVVNQG